MNKSRSSKSRSVLLAVLSCLGLCGHAVAVDRNVPDDYPTIQAAVDAALPGDTVRIAAGDYNEQVVLAYKTDITLAGQPGAAGTVIHATPGMAQSLRPYSGSTTYPVVGAYRATGLVLSGLTIDGNHLAALYNPSGSIGIYLLGSSGQVTNCTVIGSRNSTLDTEIVGWGLLVLNLLQSGTPAVNVGVFNSTFADNQVSLLLRGDPANNPQLLRATVTIKGNTIMGFGPAPHANLGIWLVNGVTGEIIGNTISRHYGATNWFASGIAAYDSSAITRSRFVPLFPVKYEGNTFTNNDQHLLTVGGNNCQVVNNSFLGGAPAPSSLGAVALSGTNILVANNNFSDLPTGIVLLGDKTLESSAGTWPAMIPVSGASLSGNWFCNVPERLQINPIATGVREEGTETCPFRPRFQSVTRSGAGGVWGLLRGWSGDTLVLEASTNLQQWVPVQTNTMALPLLEYQDATAGGAPHRFYRARLR